MTTAWAKVVKVAGFVTKTDWPDGLSEPTEEP